MSDQGCFVTGQPLDMFGLCLVICYFMSQPVFINKPVKVLLCIDAHTKAIVLHKVLLEGTVYLITKNTIDHRERIGEGESLYIFSATGEEETYNDKGPKKRIGMELTMNDIHLWDFRVRHVVYDT